MGMTRSTRLFFAIILTVVFGSTIFSFYRFSFLRDYVITAETECDPAIESCFVRPCDPEEDDVCDEDTDPSYYRIVEKQASSMPTCDPHEDASCDPFACESDSPVPGIQVPVSCIFTYCDEENVPDGERCSGLEDVSDDFSQDDGNPESVELVWEDPNLLDPDADSGE
jgi:hypothetical protein